MKRHDKIHSVHLLFALILTFCMGMPLHGFSKDIPQKHILLLSSYFPDKENSKIIIGSFSRQLSSELDCRITVEYLDSESTTDFPHWQSWMTQLFEAYNNPPDAVVIIGSEGWMAYTATCPPQWKEIPVILGFMKKGYIDYAHVSPPDIRSISEIHPTPTSFGDFHVTGYYVEDYFKENLQLIKRLQPQVRHISYIYDNRYSFTFLTPYLEKLVKEAGFENLCPYYGNKLATMQLADTLKAQDSSYAILSSGWYTDINHYPHSYSMLHNELSQMHSKYFYLMMDQGTYSPNYLGGYYVAAEDIGHDLAGLAHQVLTKGIENSPKFQTTPSKPQYYINYKTLMNSGIDASLLPPDAILYNKAPSFFKAYSRQILGISLVFFCITFSLILWVRYYKRVAAFEEKMMHEQKQLREKADESNRLKSAFLANMSHEIRTPLNAIVGFSTQLAYTEDKEDMKEFISIIEANNELLLQLVNDILDLSKIEAGQLDFIYSDVNVIEVCRNLEQVYQSRVKKGVELVCDLPDAECVIHTERNRVTQVISNFLSNAVKFTSNGHIRMGYEHMEGGLRFFVEDTGKGIAPENLPHVFTRFAKFDPTVSGNGLGMSICQNIIEKLGGKIGVDSEPGKGSTFWFTLPCEMLHR